MRAASFAGERGEQLIAVEDGCALAVLDDIPHGEALSPRLAAWIFADGAQHEMPTYEPTERMRAALRHFLEEREPSVDG